jgi:hypothetical protein
MAIFLRWGEEEGIPQRLKPNFSGCFERPKAEALGDIDAKARAGNGKSGKRQE